MGKAGLIALILALNVFLLPFESSMAFEEDNEEEGQQVNRIAVLETDYGVIKFVLYENWTPITTQNFIGLAESGHYNSVLFHRIVDDFVIQTGDGGGSDTIPLEIHPNATHIDGAVGMARSEDPDSAEDQFYICDGPQHGLDGDYAVFGVVIEGIEVVREIAQVPVYGENNPRPGSFIPLIWHNVGQPKEDVYLQGVSIMTPKTNESMANGDNNEGGGTDYPIIAIAFVIIAAVAIFVFIKFKRKSGNK